MKLDKISIITLTYNNWRVLGKAVTSVVNQHIDAKYQIEYLIVDDCTDDFDVEFADGLLRDTGLNYKIIVNNQNVGTVASFNNAIQQSTGDIIVPLSADDEFFDKNVVGDIVKYFHVHDCFIVTGLRQCLYDDGRKEILPNAGGRDQFSNRSKLLKHLLLHSNIISGASTYYRRDFFYRIGFFDESYRLLEDYPFYIKALTAGYDIYLMNRVTIQYGTDGVSSHKQSNLLKSDYQNLYDSLLGRDDISFFQKRKIKFFFLKYRYEKLIYSVVYPEQFLWFLFLKIMHVTSKLF